MSREILRRRLDGSFFLPSSPCVGVRIRDFPGSGDSSRWRDDVLRFLTQTSSAVVRCQPWFYLRLEAYSFFWLSEGAYGFSTVAQAACCFRCSASKHTPFFQTSKVIAAILRAKVRRAIGGFIPLATI